MTRMRLVLASSLLAVVIAFLAAWVLPGTDSSTVQASEPMSLPAPLGTRLVDWALPRSTDGKAWSLAQDGREARLIVVLFLGTQCPVNNLTLPALTALHKKYSPQKVLFVAINSNSQDDRAAVASHAKEFQLPFVVLKDEGARVADRFAAQRTPEAFVLDETRTVRYRGRIDDRYDKGVQRAAATRHDLADAIDALLQQREIARPVTEAAGCPIARAPRIKAAADSSLTYTRQVAPIIQKHCQDCHRPGEAGPFSLLHYRDAAAWSAAIREVVADQRMPPWHADPAHGTFRNARSLSAKERTTLLNWIDAGCPEGNPADLPPPRKFVKGWRIGKPDAIFKLQEVVKVPAQAPKEGIPYKFLVVSEPFAEDKWVTAVECRPGAASVVHHITAFLVAPGTDITRWQKQSDLVQLITSYSDDGFLAGYSPGEDPLTLPGGQAKRIPKGARIALEMHYTPNGTAAEDRSYVGVIYAKEPPRQPVLTGSAMQAFLLIPPGVARHRVVASRTFERDAMLLSVCPHMHLRARSAVFTRIRPGGKREILLSVPRYDFNWQTNYYLAQPLRIDKGDKIEFEVIYDNSRANPNNPDPTRFVSWGEQSWDEMMIGFFEYHWAKEK